MKSLKGITLALISSGTFGLIPLFSIPLLNAGLDSPSILFYRFLISTILMAMVCLIRKESFKIEKRHLASIFCMGLFYAATALFLLYSYNFIPSGIATTIHFLYPILVSFLMVIFFKEKRSIILLIAAILSLVGVVMLCWTNTVDMQLKGLVIAGLTVITYAVYIVYINQSKAGKKINAEVLTFYILLSGAFIFFIFAMTTSGIKPIPNLSAFGRLVALAFLATVISDLALVMAIKNIGSTVTSILGSLEPVVAVSVGVFYFSEHFDSYSFLGIALIIISVCLVVSKTSKRDKETNEEEETVLLQHQLNESNRKEEKDLR